jgi:hypothetical protein
LLARQLVTRLNETKENVARIVEGVDADVLPQLKMEKSVLPLI